MITFESSVRIERPIEEVFAFVSDPLQFPLWNSAVKRVQRTAGEPDEPGSTYSMERELPEQSWDTWQLDSGVEVDDRVSPVGHKPVVVDEWRWS